jgi:malate permease and related proteins
VLQATESLIPIILLVGLGTLLFKVGFITSEVRGGMDKFTYWIALPSLFIHQLSATDFRGLETGGLLMVLTLSIVATALLATAVAFVLRLDTDQVGVFVQVGFRGNMAFVGLPLIIFSLNGTGDSERLVASALIALAAMVPLNNLLAVMALVMARHGMSWSVFGTLIKKVAFNPLIISAVLGGLLGWFNLALPVVIDRPFELLGQTALALALVSLGGALIELEMRGRLGLATAAGGFKVAAVPLVTYGLALLWGLPADQTFIVMVFAACPAATASYILTTQVGGDDALAAASIVVSTFMSFAALAVVLVFVPAW